MWIGNLMLVVLNLPLIGIWIKLLTVPYRMLYPAILLFCAIGVYTINNTSFDVMQTAFFGFLGVLFVKLECEPAPLLLGFVLGPMMEENLRRALLLSRGDPTVFADAADLRRRCWPPPCCSCWSSRCRTSARSARKRSRKRRRMNDGADPRRTRIRLVAAVPFAAPADLRAQRRRDVAAARHAGGHRDARARRQRRRCRARHGDHAHRRRAVQQRHRLAICSRSCGTATSSSASTHRAARRRRGRRERFAGRDAMPQRGWDTVTIPGAVSGWVALSQRYGKLPFADLFEPAIRYARDGYAVSPVVAEKWALAAPLMPQGPRLAGAFPAARPRAASPASASRRPRWRATLEKIARRDGEAFYRGELARGDGRARAMRTAARTRSAISPRTHARLGDAARASTIAA